MQPFDIIVFDLDDTLLDTSSLLVPVAVQMACQTMIDFGLCATISECITFRNQCIKHFPRANPFKEMINHFDIKEKTPKEQMLEAAQIAFCQVPLPNNLAILDGGQSLLENLTLNHKLFLLTIGHTDTQNQKINKMGIRSFFHEILLVDNKSIDTKFSVFEKLVTHLSSLSIRPERILSVGDRLDQEIAAAKLQGCKTCWFKNGEHSFLQAQKKEEFPDFIIYKLSDLIKLCQWQNSDVQNF